MKSLIFSVSFCLTLLSFTTLSAQQRPPAARDILKEACAKAGNSGKKVFVIFHASWCGWCHRMDTAMSDITCRDAFNDNYIIRHITVQENADNKALENPGGKEMLQQYHGDKEGIPFWLIFDASGKLLADSRMRDATNKLQNIGCPSTPEEVAFFVNILEKTSHMKPDQLTAIKARFTKK